MTEEWHVGRKEIINYLFALGFLRSNRATAWRTVARWKKQGAINLRHDSAGRPFLIKSEVLSLKIMQAEKAEEKELPSLCHPFAIPLPSTQAD